MLCMSSLNVLHFLSDIKCGKRSQSKSFPCWSESYKRSIQTSDDENCWRNSIAICICCISGVRSIRLIQTICLHILVTQDFCKLPKKISHLCWCLVTVLLQHIMKFSLIIL